MHKLANIILAASLLTACQAEAADDQALTSSEAEDLKAWTRQMKADDPGMTRLLLRECGIAGAFGSAESKLATMRCMRRKYEEGTAPE